MFKYPFIEPQELPIVSEEVNIEQGELEALFNGKKSIESIYAELLAKDLSLDGINSIFKILLSKKILKDKIYLESDVLSAEKIDKYKSQIETFSYFSQSQEEDNYYNLLFGLSCQEKLFKSKIHLIGNTPLIFELNKKLKLLGIVDIKISEKIETLSNSDLLIFHFNRYKEDLLINALEYCKANNVPFLPVNNASFGAEIGPYFISTENSCSLCLIDRKKSVVGDFYFQDNTKFNFNISI